MLGTQNTQEELLTAFHHDAQRWVSIIGYLENDILFINRLLNSDAFEANTPNLFERLQQFDHETETKSRETRNLKKEIMEYEDQLKGILECQDISCDTYYLENHKDLKDRFEEFYQGFSEYKMKLFNYVGAIL